MNGWRTKIRLSGIHLASALGIVVIVAIGSLLQSAPAQAAARPRCAGGGPQMFYGVYEWCGYFNNHFANTGVRLWNNGVPAYVGTAATPLANVNQLINFIEGERLDQLGDGSQGVTSAEFVIDTMLGYGPNSNPVATRGLAWQPKYLTLWENDLRLGVTDNVIKINWFENVNWQCGQKDTYYQGPAGGGGLNDVAFYLTVPGGEIPSCGPGVTVPAIVIRDVKTNAVVYEIKRICGNPFGFVGPLPSVAFTVVPGGFVSQTQVPVGGQDTLHVTLDNKGPANSETGVLQVGATSPAGGSAFYGAVTNPCAPGAAPCTPATQSGLAVGHSSAHGFSNVTQDGKFTGAAHVPDWWWTTNIMASGVVGNATVVFNIPKTAPLGVMTFNVCFDPTTDAGTTQCTPVTVDIVSERSTLVVGENGDVHAGGGLCGKTQTPGDIVGNGGELPASSSYTQYVVSATDSPGGIADFGSNQSASGSAKDTLDLGSQGGYEEVCREDLLAAANAYRATPGATYTQLGGNTPATAYNLAGMSGLYFVNGTSYFKGQVNNKTTIVQTAGNFNIIGNINLTTNPYLPTQVPSLGVIAANNILIDASVTHVDAYLFADGYIDTCVQGEISKTACTNNLTVDGFLMGSTIEFHRIGTTNTNGAQIVETVVLTPQIYLNPPQFFDASVDDVLLQGQGEEQPLF